MYGTSHYPLKKVGTTSFHFGVVVKVDGYRVLDSTNRDVPDVIYAYTIHYKHETYFSSIKVLELLTLFYE